STSRPEPPRARLSPYTTLFRSRWDAAARQLEAYRQQTGSAEQHPVLADCYRALGRHKKADKLWDELRQANAPADIVTEGRIVTRSEEHTSELQSLRHLVCRLLL